MFNIFFTLALQYLNPIGNPQAIVAEDELEKDEGQEMGKVVQVCISGLHNFQCVFNDNTAQTQFGTF
jgi:hypothetical protein